ncbi:RELT-like protein 2 [Aulostomus maculatus]
MTELGGSGDAPPPYMLFLVVFFFFLTGLLGFLICHLLKKKGYRCRTGDINDEDEEDKLRGNADDDDEENQDTVEQILKCIIENEANMEAFNEMLGSHNVCVRHDPRLRKESLAGVPPHHHTVHSGSDNSCHLCAQIRSKKGRRQSRTSRFKQRPGEQTVLSVGRFRVTHTDKKLPGLNPLVGSGNQLDQSQDSEEQKDGGYNLRSMFKDIRPPSENFNGTPQTVGKRRKSLTIFGLRRGSDPAVPKVGDKMNKEIGEVRLSIQQQPVTLEEPLQAQSVQATSGSGIEIASEHETETTSHQSPASSQYGAKTLGSVNSQKDVQVHDSSSAPQDGSKFGPNLEPNAQPPIRFKVNLSDENTAASLPSTSPFPSSSGQKTFLQRADKGKNVENQMLNIEEVNDPGPLQTSTPIAPEPGSFPGLTPAMFSGNPEGLPVTQTPPEPSSGADLEQDFGVGLISLGSSPSLSTVRTPSSVSSAKVPTSSLVVTPSPKLHSRKTTSEATEAALSPVLTPNAVVLQKSSPLQARTPSPVISTVPKLDTMPTSLPPHSSSPVEQISNVSSAGLNGKSGMTFIQKDMVSSPLSLKEQEGARMSTVEDNPDIKRAGILKKAKLSPAVSEVLGTALSSPSYSPPEAELLHLPLSVSSPTSTASLPGSRISHMTTVQSSPDSKRELSGITMVETKEQPLKGKAGENSVPGVESGKGATSSPSQGGPAGVGHAGGQAEELSEAEVSSLEMEDMREHEATEGEDGERV